MRILRSAAFIISFLIIAVSIPQSFFSQAVLRQLPQKESSQQKQSMPRQRPPKRPQSADALAAAIRELLKIDPLAPGQEAANHSDDEKSEAEAKPPADDAPIVDLIAYWTDRNGDTDLNAPKPSDSVRRRLLEVIEDRPEMAVSLVVFAPETSDSHDRLYKLLEEETEDEGYWKYFLKDWLKNNSSYFREELIEEVRNMGLQNQLRSLARLDWETAKPILENLAIAGNPQSSLVAISLLYDRAMQGSDTTLTEKYRGLLKAIVGNRGYPNIARQTALSSLMTAEWNGQEDWVVSLFADPTLNNLSQNESRTNAKSREEPEAKVEKKIQRKVRGEEGQTNYGPLSLGLDLKMEKWFSVVTNLVGHSDPTVHKSAVKNIVRFLSMDSIDKEKKKHAVAQKLIPWLTDPGWAEPEDRTSFLQSLDDLQTPELISGLVWVLDHDEDTDNRALAAKALIRYRDPRAIPALRRALEKEGEERNRAYIVTALIECGGVSDDEIVAAVEACARDAVSRSGQENIDTPSEVTAEPLPLKVSIGRILRESDTISITEAQAVRLFDRAKALRRTQPSVAREILRVIEEADLNFSDINVVERIGSGWADLETITIALFNRGSLQKSAGDEIYNLIKQGGYARGVAAAILNDESEYREALKGADVKVQTALLASARYLRDKLPIELVVRLLDSPNRVLALAAESYLEVEDSAVSRKTILARHPGEAYILGFKDSQTIMSGITMSGNEMTGQISEEKLRAEIKSQNGPQEIYAIFKSSSLRSEKGVIIRNRNGRAEISVHEAEGRRNVRWLSAGELEELKSFSSRQEVEDLGPEIMGREYIGGDSLYEYLRLTKAGGRRIVLNSLRRASKNPSLHEELSGLFYRLSVSGEFVTRYTIEDKIPGVEVLFAEKKRRAVAVCEEGRGVRVLLAEKGIEYLEKRGELTAEWRDFSSGKLGGVIEAPESCIQYFAPETGARFYAAGGDEPGIWKAEPEKEPIKLIDGQFNYPVIVTPDGKWLVVVKILDRGERSSQRLIRYNLQTGQEFTIKLPEGAIRNPVTYVTSLGKILLSRANYTSDSQGTAQNLLLDPETGIVQNVKGEFRPLVERGLRGPQPTEKSNEFWAAISNPGIKGTVIGRYDTKNFSFTPALELPEMRLTSSDIWVDSGAEKIWIVYQGQLLRAPMPAISKRR